MKESNEVNIKIKKVGKKKKKVKIYKEKNKNKVSEKNVIEQLRSQYKTIDCENIKNFKDFPLSKQTLQGLQENSYKVPTDIQRETIGLSLQGHDVLGAARTGSGKTLAFLIPVLEVLYCNQWTRLDGLGALIITPTRELAYQIFEMLKKIGNNHDFSAGLIIGGKDLYFEKKRMDRCNIIICTPGRLLQHMDENPLFDAVTMKILVLDEADRCLDMGFAQTMNAIIENLPPERQTLLFSATQTKSVKDLARLSLKDPMYVSVHEKAEHSTPSGLQQSYIICELHEKLPVIWSFIKNHLKQKSLIFFSSCKQVKYMYEIFCKLRPGISLLALYGSLHQMKRMAIYESFCRKSNAVLFATDIAARGLDFPEVNWVVQADCPEDATTYIHRAGRTARYEKGGESLLVLLPSEKKMIQELEASKIPIKEIRINPNKLQNPRCKVEAFLAQNPVLKESAQRAFVAYIKSVFLMKNKQVFDINLLNTNAFATSLGLALPPRIRFLQRLNKKSETKIKNTDLENVSIAMKSSDESDADNNDSIKNENIKNLHKIKIKSEDVDLKMNMNFSENGFGYKDSDSEEDILKVKRKDHDIEDLPYESEPEKNSTKSKKPLTKAAVAKRMLKKKIIPNSKLTFNEEGEAIVNETKEKCSEVAQEYENENVGGIDIEKAKIVLREEDKFDKQRFRLKVKEKHRTEKKKLKKLKKQESEEVDDFGSEDESDVGPDLSWLPDPDKIYGEESDNNKNGNRKDVEDNFEVESSNDSESIIKHDARSLKRKLVSKKNDPKRLKKDIKAISNSLTINEAEDLALQLLRGK